MIARNLGFIRAKIRESALHAGRKPDEISLVAVTKDRLIEILLEAYNKGILDFGESRLQEALIKMEGAPKNIRWHFIGRLQKNKISKIVGRFSLIHSVENLEFAKKISEVSLQRHLVTSILLEVNTSGEETKGGLTTTQWKVQFPALLDLKGIEIEGLMTMAPFTEDESLIRSCFSSLRHLRDELSAMFNKPLATLSMGMSNDYLIAIQEGSTLIRLGTALFSPH